MNKYLLAAGGGILMMGGLAYYLLQQGNGVSPPPPTCTQHNGDPIGCASQADCHYCPDGTCRPESTPCEYEPCSQGIGISCYDGVNGLRRCDRYDNLCECQPPNWVCVEPESYNCINDIKHGECYVNEAERAICLDTFITGADLCTEGFDYGCPCGGSIICSPDTSFCDLRVSRCIRRAMAVNITADSETWEGCWYTTCDWNENGKHCIYNLDREWAASTLNGDFTWEDGGFGCIGELWIDGWLDGAGWTNLYYHSWDAGASTGSFQVIANFSLQGIHSLRFKCCGSAWYPLKPKSFYGTLSAF